MTELLETKIQCIVSSIKEQSMQEYSFESSAATRSHDVDLQALVEPHLSELPSGLVQRIRDEFLGLGPIENLLSDDSISEILINSPDDIWYESKGRLFRLADKFHNVLTFQFFLNKLLLRVDGVVNKEIPILDRHMDQFRVCIVDECLTLKTPILSIRRHPNIRWTLSRLHDVGWCTAGELDFLESIVRNRKRFLIIGPTGCGKTSVINALLENTASDCRSLIIEDTSEITSVNSCSSKLVTRSHRSQLVDITQSDLLKACLRLRPDRIIMGEIRGTEAKDFLMALSTGHDGSFGSLHASDPQQALLRLEMLIQMGAPQWSLDAIRKLIFLSLDGLLVLAKEDSGQRVFKGAYQITSLEPSGFLLDRWTI